MADGAMNKLAMKYDPTINLGHILTTLALIGSLVIWGVRLEGRVDQADQRVTYVERAQAMQNEVNVESMREIKSGFVRLEQKLDGMRRP